MSTHRTTKHTPGPFCVEAVTSEHLHDICLDYPVEGAGNSVLIASVYDDKDDRPGRISPREAAANARLFAAAPDLLAVLARVVAAWESIPECDQVPEEMNDDDMWDEVRRVITKAKGGKS